MRRISTFIKKMIGCLESCILNNEYNKLINTLVTMKMKSTSTWKRHQFCGGGEVFGTQCYIDELTEVVQSERI